MSRPLRVERHFFNQREAAEYCGYSTAKFRQFAKDYDIPKCGPNLNRYRKVDLDSFMACPGDFYNPLRVRKAGFIPVEV